MTDTLAPPSPAFTPEGIERRPLHVFSEKAYLDYSMYVILDRALPHLGDGLKPVQRRIVYAMSELGLTAAPSTRSRPAPSAMSSANSTPMATALLRGHGADGPGLHLSLSADGRPGQLGLAGRPQVLRRHALHRVAPDRLRRSAAGGTGPGHSGLGAQFRRHPGGAAVLPAQRAQHPAQRRHGYCRGHGHRYPARTTCARWWLRLYPPAGVTRRRQWRSCASTCSVPDFPTAAEIITPRAEICRLYETGNGSLRHARASGSWSRRYRHHCLALPGLRQSRVLEQIAAADAAKKLPWSRTCATSPITRIRRAWSLCRARTALIVDG